MEKLPLVSIITPVYNSSRFVHTMIQSVLGQSYPNWELLLVDDYSLDNSREILKDYQGKDNRVKIFFNTENKGSGFTRNYAIEKASGQYIAFLDSDDKWHTEKLKIQIDFMLKNRIGFSHTSYGYINEQGEKIKSTFHVSKHPISYNDLLKRTEISCLTAIYDCKMIGKFYMSNHRRKQDYALWLSILKTGVLSYPLDIELAYYRQSKNSATSNKKALIIKHFQFLRETQGFSPITAMYYTFYWMVNGFIRYYLK